MSLPSTAVFKGVVSAISQEMGTRTPFKLTLSDDGAVQVIHHLSRSDAEHFVGRVNTFCPGTERGRVDKVFSDTDRHITFSAQAVELVVRGVFARNAQQKLY